MKAYRKDGTHRAGGPEVDPSIRTQVAALPWRMAAGELEILLVTSRESGRWIVPKGWPMRNATASGAAEREAWEEAGATGEISDVCVGFYTYAKILGNDAKVPCMVGVYPLKVRDLASRFPESNERRRQWFRRDEAADRVSEPELKQIIRTFDPGHL